MTQRQIPTIAIPTRSEVARINAEAAEERRRLAYEAGRFAELFAQVLAVIGKRKPDDSERHD